MDETEESASSNLPSTEPVYGGSYRLPGGTSRPQSRPTSRPTMPSGHRSIPAPASPSGQHAPSGHASALPSGHATPSGSILEAYRLVQDEEMNVLRNGQAAANSNIQLLMDFSARLTTQLSQSNESLVRQMTEQAEAPRLHMDACMANFAQIVEAPVQHVVQASPTASNMASELAGQYAGIQVDMLRTFNAATTAHQASELARTEALQQAQVSRHNLDLATAAMTQVRHESASSRAQTETLAVMPDSGSRWICDQIQFIFNFWI
jgi:hypothetical protein